MRSALVGRAVQLSGRRQDFGQRPLILLSPHTKAQGCFEPHRWIYEDSVMPARLPNPNVSPPSLTACPIPCRGRSINHGQAEPGVAGGGGRAVSGCTPVSALCWVPGVPAGPSGVPRGLAGPRLPVSVPALPHTWRCGDQSTGSTP